MISLSETVGSQSMNENPSYRYRYHLYSAALTVFLFRTHHKLLRGAVEIKGWISKFLELYDITFQ